MNYVALLRGINVGGNNKVDMKQLKSAMEKTGFDDVLTYINSGNIIFKRSGPERAINTELEHLIKDEFNLNIKVLLRTKENIQNVANSIPKSWNNGKEMKCDILFLWEKYNTKNVLNKLSIKPNIDNVSYVDGALIWKVNREDVTKSGMMKLHGTDLYKNITVRNCNTVRKLAYLME